MHICHFYPVFGILHCKSVYFHNKELVMAQDFTIFPSMTFVDLGLYQFGRENCDPAHSFGPAIRNHYLFHYILNGKGTFFWQDARGHEHEMRLKAGQGFLISPRQITTYVADERIPWEYCWLEFDGLRAKESLEIIGLSVNNPIYNPVHPEFSQIMKEEMLYIVRNKKEAPLHLIGHLYLFIDALMRSVKENQPTVSKVKDYYIKEALAYIEHNYMNDISVESIAESSGLNRSYFGKIFKESVGKSPQEFLISYRMIKAAELLRRTRYSINEIGCAVGYPNQLHFSRAFKSVYGVSPRNWRNANTHLTGPDIDYK
jgi:AraC-like DNA-binding protein